MNTMSTQIFQHALYPMDTGFYNSLGNFRKMEDRLNRHPEWAILDRRPGQPLRRG